LLDDSIPSTIYLLIPGYVWKLGRKPRADFFFAFVRISIFGFPQTRLINEKVTNISTTFFNNRRKEVDGRLRGHFVSASEIHNKEMTNFNFSVRPYLGPPCFMPCRWPTPRGPVDHLGVEHPQDNC
jgi:hypothetical protein